MFKNNKSGFTIIEVVLVLAIAGLIFLMVFIALPALQRSQRDTQRKKDISRFKDAIERYKANNRGGLPWSGSYNIYAESNDFAQTYLRSDQGEFLDPSGTSYTFSFDHTEIISATNGYIPPSFRSHISLNRVYIFATTRKRCNGSAIDNIDQPRRYAIQIPLESGGIYCLDG